MTNKNNTNKLYIRLICFSLAYFTTLAKRSKASIEYEISSKFKKITRDNSQNLCTELIMKLRLVRGWGAAKQTASGELSLILRGGAGG